MDIGTGSSDSGVEIVELVMLMENPWETHLDYCLWQQQLPCFSSKKICHF